MEIKDSKFFSATDLKVLRALGFKKPEVEGSPETSEEIDLGDSTCLVGKRADLMGVVYFVNDHECHECYKSAGSPLMAMANYLDGHMVSYGDSQIPDWFWPDELHTINIRVHQGKNVHVKRFQKYGFDLGKAIVISGDRKRVKLAMNKFSDCDEQMRFVPLPEKLPDYDEWETINGKDGKPLEASCEEILKWDSFAEQARALNLVVKTFYDRI